MTHPDVDAAHLNDERRNQADGRISAVFDRAFDAGAEAMERLALVLEAFEANPDAFAEVAAVLSIGGVKHGGGLGPDDVQTPEDHMEAACRHADRVSYVGHLDADTGRLTLAHIGARAVLAIQRARTGEGR